MTLSVILALLVAAFTVAQDYFEVAVGETCTYFVNDNEGSEYYWTVFNDPDFIVPAKESEAYFPDGNSDHAAQIEWRKEGLFYVAVVESGITGCMNVKVKAVKVNAGEFTVSAGNDTLVGSCNPVQLRAVFTEQDGMTYRYLWEPAEFLDNPASSAPVFTPDSSVRFLLTVTNNLGVSAHSAIQINVSELFAKAGEDRFIYPGETLELDGNQSRGEGLQYFWSTGDGEIISGAESANPVIRGAGIYMLKVIDRFGCEATDTMTVELPAHDPLVFDDYDTTEYRTALKINVLENDHDPGNRIDHGSFRISVPPMHGSAIVDITDHSVSYIPGRNYSGIDQFRYLVCDISGNCYEGKVFVKVNHFRFFIPEAFSPNNDGINDYFQIPGIEFYDNNSIEIFNRWGNRVYRAEKYGINTFPIYWNGKSNTGFRSGNELLATGTYFYVIDLGNGEKRIVGSIYLDR